MDWKGSRSVKRDRFERFDDPIATRQKFFSRFRRVGRFSSNSIGLDWIENNPIAGFVSARGGRPSDLYVGAVQQ